MAGQKKNLKHYISKKNILFGPICKNIWFVGFILFLNNRVIEANPQIGTPGVLIILLVNKLISHYKKN